MEPQWNPMLEEQALDRIHRIGQTKPVTTIRYIIKDSFEEVSLLSFDNSSPLVLMNARIYATCRRGRKSLLIFQRLSLDSLALTCQRVDWR